MKPVRFLFVLAAFQCVSVASAPVGTVLSGDPLTLDGHSILAPGVSSYPVVIGDEVATTTGPAIMSFLDGSRLTLAPKSTVKIVGTNAKPTVVLTAGNLEYRIAAGSPLTLTDTDPPRSQKPNDQNPPQAAGRYVMSQKAVVLIGVFAAVGLIAIIPIVNALHANPIPSASAH